MMMSKASRTRRIIAQAESYSGIQAGIAPLEDVLKAPSYLTTIEESASAISSNMAGMADWLPQAKYVLVLGLHHPENDPRLDWWERGDTWGNRRLREISQDLKQWVHTQYDLDAQPLSYHVEKGGLFLKDAAALAGVGIIGRNNLLLHPQWGPRIRLRSVLLAGDWQKTEALEGFNPCASCEGFCQKACLQGAFSGEKYSRSFCRRQMKTDEENKVPLGDIAENGKPTPVISYCRACELSCPVGT
jgi:epoxyqueuosine reductase